MLMNAYGGQHGRRQTPAALKFCRRKADHKLVTAVRVVQVVKPSTMRHAFSSTDVSGAIMRDHAAACNHGMHNGGVNFEVAK